MKPDTVGGLVHLLGAEISALAEPECDRFARMHLRELGYKYVVSV